MGSAARRGGSSGRTGRSAFPDRRGANISGNNNGGKLTVSGVVNESDNVAGWYLGEGNAVSGELRIDGETQASGNILGGYTEKGGALANSVMIGSSVRPAENEAGEELAAPLIVGGGSADGDASDKRVTVTGGDMNLPDDLPGHLEDMPDISGMVNAQAAIIAGGMAEKGTASGNSVAVDDHSAAMAEQMMIGGAGGIGASGNGAAVNDHSMAAAEMMAGGMAAGGAAAAESRASGNRLGVYDRSLAVSAMMAGGMAMIGEASDNELTVSGGSAAAGIEGAGLMAGGMSGFSAPDDIVEGAEGNVSGNRLGVYDSSVIMTVMAGGMTGNGAASGNTVLLSGSDVNDPDSFSEGLKELAGEVPQTIQSAGGMAVNGDASGNTVIITDGTTVGGEAVIVGGAVGVTAYEGGQAEAAGAADVSGAELYGWRAEDGTTEVQETSGNTLVIDNWSGSVKKAQNFDAVRFDSVTWEDGGTVLEATDGEDAMLADAEILADDLVIRGENTPQAGERMTFIKGTEASAGEQEGPLSFTKGTVTQGTAVMEQETAGSLDYVIQTVGLNPQTAAVNRGRLTGAAFVNQGADIAADAVSLLDDGYHWGTRTFGAVYGSRSEYDGTGGIRVNGWNTIVGAGNVHEIKDGRLAWGVFYENGTGNYHTRNMFNNEIFRGDGSLLYNGGGAAVRLTKNGGSYYEASVRAGTLGNSMTDAVRDGDGNSYGFDSDSTYWGGHIGAGRLIPGSRGQWDVYGKYFHSEIEGDAFLMGGDAYRFEDMTSDRLRLGARYTADTGRAWSFYGGAAYEYEFSGDSRMKAGPWEAREESLQGSSVFGEIGVLMRDKDSPWSMDINLQGYTGEREGISGMLQLAYSF